MEPAQLQELARWRNEDWQPDEAYLRPFRSATKLVAIGGCGRSGSTLLRHMLGAHSLIADGPESSLFLPVPLDLPDLSVRFDLPLDELQALERSSPSRGAFIDGFQALYLRKRGRRLWLDKTSRNVHCFRYIASRFPNAKLLHIVRDPRDTVCSLRTHPVVRKRDPSRGLTGWVNPLDECIGRWKRSIEDALPCRELPGYYELRYEDLVLDPRRVLVDLCRFLEVPFEEGMLAYHRRFERTPPDLRFIPNNERATKPLSPGRMGRWRNELTEAELERVLAELGPYMAEFGYREGS